MRHYTRLVGSPRRGDRRCSSVSAYQDPGLVYTFRFPAKRWFGRLGEPSLPSDAERNVVFRVKTVRTAKGPPEELIATLGKRPGLESRTRHGREQVADLL